MYLIQQKSNSLLGWAVWVARSQLCRETPADDGSAISTHDFNIARMTASLAYRRGKEQEVCMGRFRNQV